jgi:hypothetical protein
MNHASRRWVLRDLPVAARLVVAGFLVSVGIGYFAALVQLHFQHAGPGKLLPDAEDAAAAYFGRAGASQLERLLTADESKPFNGSGSMRPAFTVKSAGWKRALKKQTRERHLDPTAAEADLRRERDGERLALLAWVGSGAGREEYETDRFTLPGELHSWPVSDDFTDEGADGRRVVHIRTILERRCVRCHSAHVGGPAAELPLETYEEVLDYCQPEARAGGMSLKKLAQTTHVHLLGFAMLYGLTGLVFAISSYPGWVRVLVAPWPLLAQVLDISCWWLGRLDPLFARAIVATGGLVAVGLGLQIVLSLFNLFGRAGKTALLMTALAACLGGCVLHKEVIGPYLHAESQMQAGD